MKEMTTSLGEEPDSGADTDPSSERVELPALGYDKLNCQNSVVGELHHLKSLLSGSKWSSIRTVMWSLQLLRIFVCLSFSTEASAELKREMELLLYFKGNITDQRFALKSWNPESALAEKFPCDLYDAAVYNTTTILEGVECAEYEGPDGSTRHLVKLHLNGLRLQGNVQAVSILDTADFPLLQELDLSFNGFSGTLPRTWRSESTLRSLRLKRNLLTGPLTRLPSNLIHLDLSLQRKGLEGDLKNLVEVRSLKELDLHGNKFSGGLADNWRIDDTQVRLPLYSVDLSDNQLEGPIPTHLACMIQARSSYLNLSSNKLTGNIPDFQFCAGTQSEAWRIESVDLSNNQLNGRIPRNLLRYNQLVQLRCSRNNLVGSLDLSNVNSNLLYLDLSENQLESIVGTYTRTPRLKVLNLQQNNLTGGLENLLENDFNQLTELRLNQNSMTVNSSFTLDKISTFLFLEVLDLSFNSLNIGFPAGLFQLQNLNELRLRHNFLNGELSANSSGACVTGWKNLKVLDLRQNNLTWGTGTDLRIILDRCSSLRDLRLGSSRNPSMGADKISKEVFSGDLSRLQTLDLSGNNLEGDINVFFSSLVILPALEHLDLSDNRFFGKLDQFDPKRFPRLTHLNLSNNQGLSGAIPSSILLLNIPSGQYNDLFKGTNLCGYFSGSFLVSCRKGGSGDLQLLNLLTSWQFWLILASCAVVSGAGCLVLGLQWRRRVDAQRQKHDAELIEILLDREIAVLMPFRDLRKATDNFSEKSQIGQGGFGTVYVGTLEGGTMVAVKKSTWHRDASGKSQFLNEVKILSQVHHRNLVRLLGCCLADRTSLLVFEYIPNGTLQEHLRGQRGDAPLTWRQRLHIAIQTADALDYLHSSANPPIYHLDVKSANILLNNTLNAKVADFGISRLVPALDVTHFTAEGGVMGTPGYIDPETVRTSKFSGKSDVYALGVVLLELITAQPAVERSKEEHYLVRRAIPILEAGRLDRIVDGAIWETFLSDNGKESIHAVARLAARCLSLDFKRRPTMKEVSIDLQAIRRCHCEPGSAVNLDDDIYVNSLSDAENHWNFAVVGQGSPSCNIELRQTSETLK